MGRNTRRRTKARKLLHQALRAWEEWAKAGLVSGELKLVEPEDSDHSARLKGGSLSKVGRTWIQVQHPEIKSVQYSERTGILVETTVVGVKIRYKGTPLYKFYDRVRELDEQAFQRLSFVGFSKSRT